MLFACFCSFEKKICDIRSSRGQALAIKVMDIMAHFTEANYKLLATVLLWWNMNVEKNH
jgi:hypothetical protein